MWEKVKQYCKKVFAKKESKEVPLPGSILGVNLRFDPLSTQEDIYVPVRSKGELSIIEGTQFLMQDYLHKTIPVKEIEDYAAELNKVIFRV